MNTTTKKSRGQRVVNRFRSVGIVSYLSDDSFSRPTESDIIKAIDSGSIPNDLIAELPYTLSGDYVGSHVESSNRKYLIENYGIVRSRFGGFYSEYAGVSIVDLIESINPNHNDNRLWDDLADLQRYPVLDDSLLSELENESMSEEWELWGRSDLERAILDRLDIFGLDSIDSISELEKDSEFIETLYDNSHSEGIGYWFDVDRIAKRIVESEDMLDLIQFDVSGWVNSIRSECRHTENPSVSRCDNREVIVTVPSLGYRFLLTPDHNLYFSPIRDLELGLPIQWIAYGGCEYSFLTIARGIDSVLGGSE